MTTYSVNSIDYLNRAIKSALIAVAVTFALLSLMQFLIQDEYVYTEETTRPMPIVIMYKDPVIEVIIDEVTPPEPVEPPPTAAPTPKEFSPSPTIAAISIPIPEPVNEGPKIIALPPGEPIPYLRSQPAYPPRAQERGISGFVDLMFTINVTGATEEVQVIGAEPVGVFDRAAKRAVEKWKYRPQIADNGEAVRTAGVTTRVRFQIAE